MSDKLPEIPDDAGESEQLPDIPAEPFRPFVPGPRQPVDQSAEPPGENEGMRPRGIPVGLSRRDRREWRSIEAERLAEARDAQRAPDRWSAGFARKPPRGLGRRGRRVFREEDRRHRAGWWARQKERDLDTRGIGVLVITLLVFGVILVRLLWPSGNKPASGTANVTPPPAVTSVPQTPAATTGPASTPASTPASSSSTRTTTSAAAASVTVSASVTVFGNGTNTATPVAAAVTRAADVTLVLPSPAARVKIVAAPAGPITTVQRSTPVAVAAVWFARTCSSSWRDPYGAALTANKAVMTAPAWAYANPTGDVIGQRWWAGVVKDQQTRRCTAPVAALFAGPQPANTDLAVVTLTADRLVTAAGAKPLVEKVFQLRYMARSGSTWSVGPLVVGG